MNRAFMSRTFSIGSIWFILHYDADGAMHALEEHDMREGGGLSLPPGTTWEEYFVQRVRYRAYGDEYKDEVEKQAREFLASSAPCVTI